MPITTRRVARTIIPTPVVIPKFKFPETIGFINPGFDVFVKNRRIKLAKGKFRDAGFSKVNKVSLTKRGAFVKGAQIVDKFTNRSFFIEPSGESAKKSFKDELFNSLINQFRPSKVNPEIFVEKSGFAIDSKEEKEGIPFKAKRERVSKKKIIKKKSFEQDFFGEGFSL